MAFFILHLQAFLFPIFKETLLMKPFFLLPVFVLFSHFVFAQQIQHKIVFDFTKSDTASFSLIVRQVTNIMKATDGTAKLEIVCHGPGLDLLLKDKTNVQSEISELQNKFNVVFAACQAAMKRRGIDKSQLIPNVIVVPLASLEISTREQEGWSYIKAGE